MFEFIFVTFMFPLRKEIISRAIVFNSKEEILLVSTDGKDWHFPGGMLDDIESAEEGAIRETHEETGIDIKIQKLKAVGESLKDCRSEFNNFLRTMTFYFLAKTDQLEVDQTHEDHDKCIQYKGFFSEKEFLNLKTFFPINLKVNFDILKSNEIIYIPYRIFSSDNLSKDEILKLITTK